MHAGQFSLASRCGRILSVVVLGPNRSCKLELLRVGGEGVHTPGNLVPQSPHLGAVPRFLMCRYLSSPPGVLLMRTLLETVLYGWRRRWEKMC